MRYRLVGDGSHIDINKGGEPRTSGLHLSGIIRVLAQDMRLLDPEDDIAGLPLEARLRMAVGLAWEEWLHHQYPEVLYHPGELCQDGILMTPDGVGDDETMYEFKATWKSEKKVLGNGYEASCNWMWQAQNMGYLKALKWRRVHQCILFLNGNYKAPGAFGPPSPVFRELEIEYDQPEIEANWKLILANRHRGVHEQHG
jgi:hypothetical protein